MKNILLATTALVVTAGFASAEVTFSGRGEAGVYRLAPTAAVTAVAGRHATGGTAPALGTAATSANNTNGVASQAAQASTDTVGFVDGVLTVTARTAASTMTVIAADATSAAPASNSLGEAKANLALAQSLLTQKVLAVGTATTVAALNEAKTAVAIQEAAVAQAAKIVEVMTGTVAVAAGATADTKAYSGYDLEVKASGASDNGMTFSVGFDIGAGSIADATDDLEMDPQGGTFVAEELVIGYNGYTVKIGDNKIDDLYDDTQNGDVSVSGTIGELSFGIVTDMDKDTAEVAAKAATFTTAVGTTANQNYKAATFTDATAKVAAVWETTSYSLGYKAGDVAFSLVGTDGNDIGEAAMKVSASAPLGDFKFTASIDNKGKADDIAKLAVSYTTGGMTLTASSADDANHSLNTNKDAKASYDVGLSYAMGAATVQYNTDESAAWWANASYNLGGGAAAFATIDHTDFAVAGVKFTF